MVGVSDGLYLGFVHELVFSQKVMILDSDSHNMALCVASMRWPKYFENYVLWELYLKFRPQNIYFQKTFQNGCSRLERHI